jgi:hypothetical protein
MVATPLTPTSRYIPPGVRAYYYVPTIVDKASPSRAELDAGTDLTAEIAEVSGFQVTSESVDTPDLATRFTSKVPGRTTADDSSITFYASDTSDDVRTILPRDTAGFIVVLPEGDVPTQMMDVFPVKVAASTVMSGTEDPGQVEVSFTITGEPEQNVVIPAAV